MGHPTKSQLNRCKKDLDKIREEISNVVVGQDIVVNGLLRSLLAKGHVLLEGIPGIAKTLLVRSLAKAAGCKFKRIQFTPDLLPTDITGISAYDKEKGFTVLKGPIFSNFVLGDEINRAPPKVQSALLEVMQEKQATIGKQTFHVDNPFFVLATQNPIETLGTYTLPEAQIDRFLFKILMFYPNEDEEKLILEQNIHLKHFNDFKIKPVLSPKKIVDMQNLTLSIGHTEKIKEYIVDISNATREPSKFKVKLGKYIELGTSPRASIGMFIAAKADALLHGDPYIKPQHVKDVAHEVLRHRIILNYTGEAEDIKIDDIIDEILAKVPIP